MINNNQKSIDVLNKLIEINSNRFDGYDYAGNETKGSTMKCLFLQLSETSRVCMDELISEVGKLGGVPKRANTKDEKVLKIWIDVKIAIADNNNKVLFNSCEFEEAVILNAYENIINTSGHQDPNQKFILENQCLRIKEDTAKMKRLKAAFIK